MVVLEMGANALRSEQSGCSGAFALFCSFPDGLAGSHGERTIACVAQHVFLPKKKTREMDTSDVLLATLRVVKEVHICSCAKFTCKRKANFRQS